MDDVFDVILEVDIALPAVVVLWVTLLVLLHLLDIVK